ncbi:hypothetical protein [Microbulbifer sp. JSM ZJ756]|uniref:hypothetical protein n=1 Tax=Microbulbifer sp. JSM ZJ756 TaxID=3376191 RepID=UPI00379A3475
MEVEHQPRERVKMKERTVYIIGAGASVEAGLPAGEGLKTEIASLLDYRGDNGDGLIDDAIRGFCRNPGAEIYDLNVYFKECAHIAANMPLAISIDNFVDSQRDNKPLAFCAKLAIVKAILDAESKSKIYTDYRNGKLIDFSGLGDTWYLQFFRKLTENCTVDDLPHRLRLTTLVIFNYDRCVEQFLYHALQSYYRVPRERAAELVSSMTIIHPYGTVASLPWQNGTGAFDSAYFGVPTANPHNLCNMAGRIRTFTEGSDSEVIRVVYHSLETASRVVFLGFAFHPINMELISEDLSGFDNESPVRCYGTAFGMSEAAQHHAQRSIQSLYKNDVTVELTSVSCNQLFVEYSPVMGFA